MAGPAVCLLQSQPVSGQPGLHSTGCKWNYLSANGVGKVVFTLLGLEPGMHTLTFTLKTTDGIRDILEKNLRVVVSTCKTLLGSRNHTENRHLAHSFTQRELEVSYGCEKGEARTKTDIK